MLNVSRFRRLGPSLPEGCVPILLRMMGGYEGFVVVVGGRRAMLAETMRVLDEGDEDDTLAQSEVAGQCGQELDDGTPVRRCAACGGIGLEKDLFESARLCGEEEFERALNDEWKIDWDMRVYFLPSLLPFHPSRQR